MKLKGLIKNHPLGGMISMFVLGVILGLKYFSSNMDKQIDEIENKKNKFWKMFLILEDWIKNEQNGKKIEEYLAKQNINTVAIYGMNHIGKLLYHQLKNSGISVKYGIDQRAEAMAEEGLNVYSPQMALEAVDAVIVTVVNDVEEIYTVLNDKTDSLLLSISDIVCEMKESD